MQQADWTALSNGLLGQTRQNFTAVWCRSSRRQHLLARDRSCRSGKGFLQRTGVAIARAPLAVHKEVSGVP